MPESLTINNLIMDQINAGYPHEETGYLTDIFMPDTHGCRNIPIISGIPVISGIPIISGIPTISGIPVISGSGK